MTPDEWLEMVLLGTALVICFMYCALIIGTAVMVLREHVKKAKEKEWRKKQVKTERLDID